MAILLDLLVLGGFVWIKLNSDPLVIGVAVACVVMIAVVEQVDLKLLEGKKPPKTMRSHTIFDVNTMNYGEIP